MPTERAVSLTIAPASGDIDSLINRVGARSTASSGICLATGKRQSMTRQSTFLVQAFNNSKGGRLKPNPPVACKSADGARRTAERLSLSHVGVIALAVTSDRGRGDYGDQPTIFYRAGQLPAEFDSMP